MIKTNEVITDNITMYVDTPGTLKKISARKLLSKVLALLNVKQ